jgi:multiple sugar transport system substrate-binding protein
VLLAFTACGGNDDNGGGTQQQQEAPPATGGDTGAETPPPPADDGNQWGLDPALGGGRIHEARDFGGRTLVIGAWWDTPIGAIAWGDEPDRATSANYPIARMMWDNARRVEEVFNVRFEPWVVGFDDFLPTFSASVIAGVPAADVVILEGWMQLEAMGSVIQPWDNANLPGSDILGAQVFGGPTTQNDAGIWAINQHGVYAQAFGLGVNLDLIHAEGLPNPIDLFEAGEWTWDAMLDIMRLARAGGYF